MSDDKDRQDGGAPLEIEVEGLRKTFGRREVLKGISFGVPRGGFLSIFGPNGAGKTTTLRVIATLLTASGGKVTVAGHDVREDPMPVRKAIGFISHNAMLYPDLTAQENLRFYADMYGVEDREARITELLERLEHIVLSHQGEPEWGAAVYAATPEAVFVSMIDNLDAKMGMVQRALRQASDGEEFSERLPGLSSQLLTRPPGK